MSSSADSLKMLADRGPPQPPTLHACRGFLRLEFQSLALLGASQHIRIYRLHVLESDRAAFRTALHRELDGISQDYATDAMTEARHVAHIQSLADTLSRGFGHVLENARLRIGPAQKALNLYLKYLWCAGLQPMPPHCPMDSIVLQQAGNATMRWSQIDSIADYLAAIGVLKQAAGQVPLAVWELAAWQPRIALSPSSLSTKPFP